MASLPNHTDREDAILGRIDEWHSAPEGTLDGPLHEALGWTWDEYRAWVEDPASLPEKREGGY